MAPPMAPTSSPEPPQQTDVDTINRPSQTPTSTSLLAGFLISFLALFIIFLGGGLSSRYMVDRRRQRTISESICGGEFKDEQPSLCDIWTVPSHNEWKDMMPLSVEMRKDFQSPSPAHVDRVARQFTPTEEAIGMYRGLRQKSLKWTTHLPRRLPSSFAGLSAKPGAGDESVDLQITVLVAMPSESRQMRDIKSAITGHETAHEGLGNIQDGGPDDDIPDVAMGVVMIPWDKQRLDFG
ncbi:hypothetical protein BU17DRAFT_93556 [Hysterangium stoloniferum]|nr:hypothetical protein BU17DRAFT_93556 [Hysterangium stoloniferum]